MANGTDHRHSSNGENGRSLVCVIRAGIIIALASSLLGWFTNASGSSSSEKMIAYLGGLIGEHDCAMEVVVDSSRSIRNEYGAIATLYHASVDSVIRCGLSYDPRPVRTIEFLTEGGRIGDEVLVSDQSVSLDRGSRQVVFLRRMQEFSSPVLLNSKLIGRPGKDDNVVFSSLRLALNKADIGAAIDQAKLHSAQYNSSRQQRKGVTRIRTEPTSQTDRTLFASAIVTGYSKPPTRGDDSGGSIHVVHVLKASSDTLKIQPGLSMPISFPVPAGSNGEVLVFAVRGTDGWKLADCDDAVWEHIGNLYYPVSMQGDSLRRGSHGVSESQIRKFIKSISE